jgi:hypothetical protein
MTCPIHTATPPAYRKRSMLLALDHALPSWVSPTHCVAAVTSVRPECPTGKPSLHIMDKREEQTCGASTWRESIKAGKKENNVRTCTMQVRADYPLDPTHFHFPTTVDADHTSEKFDKSRVAIVSQQVRLLHVMVSAAFVDRHRPHTSEILRSHRMSNLSFSLGCAFDRWWCQRRSYVQIILTASEMPTMIRT